MESRRHATPYRTPSVAERKRWLFMKEERQDFSMSRRLLVSIYMYMCMV